MPEYEVTVVNGQYRYRGPCVCCSTVGVVMGRGLIARCYTRHYRAGTIDQFQSRGQRSRDETLDAWATHCRNAPLGMSLTEIAGMMKMDPRTLQQALRRARLAGDERAVPSPWSATHGRTVRIHTVNKPG